MLRSIREPLNGKGVSLAESGGYGCEQMTEIVVGIHVSRVFLNRVLESQDCGILTCLGVDDAYAVTILDREIDILKDLLSLATGAEYTDGHCHSDKYRSKCYDYIPDHILLSSI